MIGPKDQQILEDTNSTDEPIFVFRGQDELVQDVLQYYREKLAFRGATSEKIDSVDGRIREFEVWQQVNVGRVKLPD